MNKEKNNCLVYAMSPIHVVSAISAILTRHAPEGVNVVILVQWPSTVSELSHELFVVMGSMVRHFPFVERVKLVPFGIFTEMLAVNDVASFKLSLKEWIGVDHAEEIYYAHDICSQLYQGLSMVYANARRICFGEMGLVCERHVFLSYLAMDIQEPPSLTRKLRIGLGRTVRKIISIYSKPDSISIKGMVLKDFLPDEAVLILPVDMSGNFLKQTPLTVCPKPVVLDVLGKCADSCSELRAYIFSLLNDFEGQRKYLLLTENFAEGDFIEFEREVEMYCSMVSDYCEPGGVVFLKSHPGETLSRNERITERLAGKYAVVELDKKFRRYPVELWKGLILESTVISTAYPVLSLKYLYGIDVIQPMHPEFIEHWFPQRTWALHKNNLSAYMEPLKRLPQWDGKSVLWAGHSRGA